MIKKMYLVLLVLIGITNSQEMKNKTVQILPIIGLWKFYEIDGEFKWIGPFGRNLIEDVKSSGNAHKYAKKVRTASKVKTWGIGLTPILFGTGYGLILHSIKLEERGEPSLDFPHNWAGALVLASFVSFVTGAVADLMENSYLNKTVYYWNLDMKDKARLHGRHELKYVQEF